jgi:hypothetical protein
MSRLQRSGAEPGPIWPPRRDHARVPALRSSAKGAAPRPGHETPGGSAGGELRTSRFGLPCRTGRGSRRAAQHQLDDLIANPGHRRDADDIV